MTEYHVCGLTIASDQPIPGLQPFTHSGPDDVSIHVVDSSECCQTVPSLEDLWYSSPYCDETDEPLLKVWRSSGGDGYRFSYREGAEFVIDADGARVQASWVPPMTLEDFATFLLGPILGFILRLRGHVPLHASAVEIGDRGVLFVGGPGAGKSTLAAAFAAQGYPVLSDDVVLLRQDGEGTVAFPASPRVGLWPDSARALFGSAESLPRFSATYPKHYVDLTQPGYRFRDAPIRVAAIYVLGERIPAGHTPIISADNRRDGLMALIANSYSNYIPDARMRATEFEFLGRMAGRIPIRNLTVADDVTCVAGVCQVVADDLPLNSPANCESRP
jgi:hypothetical protein